MPMDKRTKREKRDMVPARLTFESVPLELMSFTFNLESLKDRPFKAVTELEGQCYKITYVRNLSIS
jgi:hypothetical protein